MKINNNQTYTYTYYFADGTKSSVEVKGDLYRELKNMDRKEKYYRRTW